MTQQESKNHLLRMVKNWPESDKTRESIKKLFLDDPSIVWNTSLDLKKKPGVFIEEIRFEQLTLSLYQVIFYLTNGEHLTTTLSREP